MPEDFYRNLNPIEKLEIKIRKEFKPKNSTPEEMSQNIMDCYEYDLEDLEQSYFRVDSDRYLDIIRYIEFCGGLKVFDFVV